MSQIKFFSQIFLQNVQKLLIYKNRQYNFQIAQRKVIEDALKIALLAENRQTILTRRVFICVKIKFFGIFGQFFLFCVLRGQLPSHPPGSTTDKQYSAINITL